MFTDNDLTTIAQQFICKKFANELNISLRSFHTIILIGSSINPSTMRKSSDLDLVVLVEDLLLNNPQDFLAHFMISHVEYNGEEINFPMDIQIYTISSFRKEMYYGSLTRVFAVLNAFQIIYAEDDCAKQIIADADQRLNNTICDQ